MPAQLKCYSRVPSDEHSEAAEAIVEYCTANFQVEAVLLVNSCARGKATIDSCLDIDILVRPEILQAWRVAWEEQWHTFNQTHPAIQRLKAVGKYSVVHLDFADGVFEPTEPDEAAGPDDFEVGIGNLLVYTIPLWQGSDYLAQLKQQWLPYYRESLRQQWLSRVGFFFLNNLHHVPVYLERGLYFQAFDRFYHAYQAFLQALFISRRTYPLAYNKWIREQIVDVLQLPGLYKQLPHLFEINRFESRDISMKARELEHLFELYVSEDGD